MNPIRVFTIALATTVVLACGDPTLTPTSTALEGTPLPTVSSSESGDIAPTSSARSEDTKASTTSESGTSAPSTTPDYPGPEETIPPTTAPMAATGEVPQSLMAKVTADASSRSKIPVDEIVVTRAEEVVWPDGSLGCPEPGQYYTQATEPGYWIVLSASGEDYDYRATESGFFKLCEAKLPFSHHEPDTRVSGRERAGGPEESDPPSLSSSRG